MKRFILATVFFLFALCAQANAATDRYVIPGAGSTGCANGSTNYHTGSNTCSGGADQVVYTSAQSCSDTTVAGDTCWFRTGTYSNGGNTVLYHIRDGNSGSPITFKNYNGESVLFSAAQFDGWNNQANVVGKYPIWLDGAEWIVIDGIKTTGGEYGIILWTSGGNGPTQNNIVQNANVTLGWQGGYLDYHGNDNTIRNSTVTNNNRANWPRGDVDLHVGATWGNGIAVYSTRALVQDNLVYFNAGEGIGGGIGFGPVTIRNNISIDNWSVNIYLDATPGGDIVEGNFVGLSTYGKTYASVSSRNGSNSDGIALSHEGYGLTGPLNNETIRNNVVVNTLSCIRSFVVDANHAWTNWTIVNNTCVNNDLGGVILNNGSAISGMVVRNNIVYGGLVDQYGTVSTNQPLSGDTFSNNLYFTSGFQQFYLNGTWYDFNGWAAAAPDSPSQFTNPLLTNIGFAVPAFENGDPIVSRTALAGNYALSASSPAINAGVAVSGVTIDILGNTRTGVMEIGAFDFSSLVVPNTPIKPRSTVKP